MTPEPWYTWAGFALMLALSVFAYHLGKDAGTDEERARNARRRAHRHRNPNQ